MTHTEDAPATSSAGFLPGVDDRLGHYVYLRIDPRNSEIFYAGKGVGGRCFSHIYAARADEHGGEYPKLDRIRDIESSGHEVLIDVLRHGLSEPESFHVEAACIDLLRLSGQENGKLLNKVLGHGNALGRGSVADINVEYGATPVEILTTPPVVLVRIPREWHRGMQPEALYEVTRGWWKVAEARRRAGSAAAPQHAFGIHRGVVRAVYTSTRGRDRVRKPRTARSATRGGPSSVAGTPSWRTRTYIAGSAATLGSPAVERPRLPCASSTARHQPDRGRTDLLVSRPEGTPTS